MFLVPYNKKTILDLTTSSSAQAASSSSTSKIKIRGFFTFIIDINTSLIKIFLQSLTILKRWLSISLRVALNSLNPATYLIRASNFSAITEHQTLSSSTSLKRSSFERNILSVRDSNYLQCTNKTDNWSNSVVTSIAQTSIECFFDTNHNKVTSSDTINFPAHNCQMDLCRRRIAQRAAAMHDNLESNSSHYWKCSTPSNHENPFTCSSGSRVQEKGEIGSMRSEEQQAANNFQGQKHICGPKGDYTNSCMASRARQQLRQLHEGAQTPKCFKHPLCAMQSHHGTDGLTSIHNQQDHQKQQQQQQYQQKQDNLVRNKVCGHSALDNDEPELGQAPLILVSKTTLSDLKDQIAFSMNKMRDLEEQVRVIPELQRRLDHVISDSSSVGDCNHQIRGRSSRFTTTDSNIDFQTDSRQLYVNNASPVFKSMKPTSQNQYNSFKTNSLNTRSTFSRDSNISDRSQTINNSLKRPSSNMLNMLRSTQGSVNSSAAINSSRVEYEDLINDLISLSYSVNYLSNTNSEHSLESNNRSQRKESINRQSMGGILNREAKMDASTNTDLSMDDIVTRDELNNLARSMQKNYSTSSSSIKIRNNNAYNRKRPIMKSTSIGSESTSGSMSGPKSSSANDESDSDLSNSNEQLASDNNIADFCSSKSNCSLSKSVFSENNKKKNLTTNLNEGEKEEKYDDETNAESLDCEEPYSLGSSYQDPSDFEEYCAYGESLDRRTKDFMSQTTKIPNDLRFALIRLNDSFKRDLHPDEIEKSHGCIDVIRKEWFKVTANKDSQAVKTKLYIEYFESFTKQLLNMVVNFTDSAGNTAMHYAASHYNLEIIKVLLDTKVCDVNYRNKAGYTPIMLLALAEIESLEEQEIARKLFSLGDVNIKARSSGQTALMLAASNGRSETCKLLLECGADPSLQDFDGSTALMCGSEIGNEEVVRSLLGHKLIDLSATDNDGLDALRIAMNNGHKNIGLLLYAANNVPRMNRSAANLSDPISKPYDYLGASLRRSRGKIAMNHVRRADSLLCSRSGRSIN